MLHLILETKLLSAEVFMTSNSGTLVTYKVFVDKMNECLHQDHDHQGMEFVCDKDGYRLIAPGMTETSRMALDKTIFDEVSKRYKITE